MSYAELIAAAAEADAALSRLRDTQRVLVDALREARGFVSSDYTGSSGRDMSGGALARIDAALASVEQPEQPYPTPAGDEEVTAREVGWHTVERDGLPPCDDRTVYVGVNSAGFAACFNHVSKDGTCTMGTAESCTAQMSCLRWWKVLDRPTGPVHGPSADWNNDYHYPRAAMQEPKP